MIAVVDYGMGNLRSVAKAVQRCGGQAEIVSDAATLAKADKIILPGVGAFADAMTNLRSANLAGPLIDLAADGKPLLGICLGFQLLFSQSFEDGQYEGLNIIEGDVVGFDFSDIASDQKLSIPHMGWNSISFAADCPLTAGLTPGDYVYFVHSYYVKPADSSVAAITCNYGHEFCAGIWRKNIFATQFHPEKSQSVGLKMIENFVNYRAI